MAQLTLSEKSALATNGEFMARVFQGLYSKANFWKLQPAPTDLADQKRINYSVTVLTRGGGVDLASVARFWLANYNADPPVLDGNSQPTDSAILDTAALDTVYDTLAGVVAGDDLLPII